MREIQYFERENDPPPLTEPTESPGKTEKVDALDDLDPEPSFSDLSSKKKKHDEKKKRCKHKKDNLSDPSSSDDCDSSYDSDYRLKLRKRNINLEKLSDQIMRTFNGKFANDSV